jgi:hypothetical protein
MGAVPARSVWPVRRFVAGPAVWPKAAMPVAPEALAASSASAVLAMLAPSVVPQPRRAVSGGMS